MDRDQFALAGVVTVRAGRVIIAAPAASATGYVSNKGPFRTSPDVDSGVAEFAVSVAPGDLAVMGIVMSLAPVADVAQLATHLD